MIPATKASKQTIPIGPNLSINITIEIIKVIGSMYIMKMGNIFNSTILKSLEARFIIFPILAS